MVFAVLAGNDLYNKRALRTAVWLFLAVLAGAGGLAFSALAPM